jgi:hypothetical protein
MMIDPSDYELSASELKQKYDDLDPGNHWSQHPHFTHQDWADEAAELNTLAGYWDWVLSQLEQHELDEELDEEGE